MDWNHSGWANSAIQIPYREPAKSAPGNKQPMFIRREVEVIRLERLPRFENCQVALIVGFDNSFVRHAVVMPGSNDDYIRLVRRVVPNNEPLPVRQRPLEEAVAFVSSAV